MMPPALVLCGSLMAAIGALAAVDGQWAHATALAGYAFAFFALHEARRG